MNTVIETPSYIVLFGVIIGITVVTFLSSKESKIFDITLRSDLFSATGYTVIDSAWRGVSPFIIIGFGDVFLLYALISLVITMLGKSILHSLKLR